MLISSQIHFIYFHQSWDTQGSGHKTWPEPRAPPDMQLGPYTDLLFWPESFHTLLSSPGPGDWGAQQEDNLLKVVGTRTQAQCNVRRSESDYWFVAQENWC